MKLKIALLILLIALLFMLNLFEGSIRIPPADVLAILTGTADGVKPSWQYIVMESRLPQAVTALLAGGALAMSGLLLQNNHHHILLNN